MTPTLAWAMEIQWTRMAGQTPVEASPLVGQFSDSGKPEILVLNQGGQLLLLANDGSAIGSGQDGLVAQLPEGRWTTAPTLIDSPAGTRFVVASVKGLVVGLDRKFQPVWQHQLPGETAWGRAVPAVLSTRSGAALVFNDLSGTVSCLRPNGQVVWTNALAEWDGQGGPWQDSVAKAGVPSDADLATGYDQKRLIPSHTSKEPVGFRLEADFSGPGAWAEVTKLSVPSGKPLEHRFPDAFGAYWLRLIAENDSTATATFLYE